MLDNEPLKHCPKKVPIRDAVVSTTDWRFFLAAEIA
jgi:hypothetical protein